MGSTQSNEITLINEDIIYNTYKLSMINSFPRSGSFRKEIDFYLKEYGRINNNRPIFDRSIIINVP